MDILGTCCPTWSLVYRRPCTVIALTLPFYILPLVDNVIVVVVAIAF